MGGKGSGTGKVKNTPAQNTAIATSIMDIMSWEKPDRKDIDGLYRAFNHYIQYCINNGVPIGNMNAYMSMGIDFRTAYDFEVGRYTPAHQKLIRDVKCVCASFREQSMAEGGINPVTGIWWQKNYDGLKDVQEVVVAPNEKQEQYSIADIQKRYAIESTETDVSDVGGSENEK